MLRENFGEENGLCGYDVRVREKHLHKSLDCREFIVQALIGFGFLTLLDSKSNIYFINPLTFKWADYQRSNRLKKMVA
jgi:hypothetical protein